MFTDKPIIWFDLETTGADFIKDRIIELAAIKINPDGTKEKYYSRFNPEYPINPDATSKHGIKNEDLVNEPTFTSKSSEVYDFFKDCDLGGYNVNKFDLPFLVEELLRSKIILNVSNVKIIDAFRIWTNLEPRKLENAYLKFCKKELINAHSAEADIEATIEIANEQFKLFNINNIDDAHKSSLYEDELSRFDLAGKIIIKDNIEYINFGKYKNQTFEYVLKNDANYINWCSTNENFPQQTRIAFKILKNKYQSESVSI